MDWYEFACKNEVNSKSKLSLYKIVKIKYGVENYVRYNLNKSKWSLVCQLRLVVLPLQLEFGRFSRINRCDRICKLCNHTVETELHFLFECEELNDVRIKLYHKNPELLNSGGHAQRYEQLCTKPYVMGNFIETLWHECNVKMNNRLSMW